MTSIQETTTKKPSITFQALRRYALGPNQRPRATIYEEQGKKDVYIDIIFSPLSKRNLLYSGGKRRTSQDKLPRYDLNCEALILCVLVAARMEEVTVETAYNISMVQSGWKADLALLGPSEKFYWRLILIRPTRSV